MGMNFKAWISKAKHLFSKGLLLRWATATALITLLVYQLQVAPLPTVHTPLKLYSNQIRKDLKKILYKSISKAQKKIAIIVYTLSDSTMIDLINEQAKKGVKVWVLVDKKQTRSLKKKLNSGVQLVPSCSKGLMHQKIFLIDDLCFIGSSNLTTASLRMHDNLMLGFYHPKLSQILFDLTHGSLPSESFDLVPSQIRFWNLPSTRALLRVIELIDNAKQSIDLAMFTLTHPKILEALIKANERGVHIRVIIDQMSQKGASHKFIEALKKHHIKTYKNRGFALMHHKMALFDDKVWVTGSTNWTQSAFTRNQDCFLEFSEIPNALKSDLKKIFRNLFWESTSCGT